jgi:hypothetical protein
MPQRSERAVGLGGALSARQSASALRRLNGRRNDGSAVRWCSTKAADPPGAILCLPHQALLLPTRTLTAPGATRWHDAP